MSDSPALRIKFIQAAKEGNLDNLKKFVEEGVPVNTKDSGGICYFSNLQHFIGHLLMEKQKLLTILFS